MSNNPRVHNIITKKYDGTLETKAIQTGNLNQTLNLSYNNDFLLGSFFYAEVSSNYLKVYGDNTYRYDDGYLIEKITPNGTTSYEYGTLGELRKVITPTSTGSASTQTIEYLHNANNQRVAKLINNEVVEKYLWANLTTLLAIYDKDDNLVQRFEYANNRMPISMMQNNEKYYLHYDQVGTLKAVSDSSQKIIKKITYDTYGNIREETNKEFKVPFGFAGGLYDKDTKLTRFGYRDYDAKTGKWMAKDPIGFAGGDVNLYGYVLGDPVGLIDPDGLQPKDKWYGYNNKNFQKWFHRCWKEAGNADADKEEIAEAYAEW